MSITEFIKQCNEDFSKGMTETKISERCTLSNLFTFIVPDNLKELSIELKDKSLQAFFNAKEIAQLIIKYITSKTEEIKVFVKEEIAEDTKRIIAFAIKFFNEISIIEEVKKVKIVINVSLDIIKILTQFGKFVAGCCKSTIYKIYKYLKQQVKKGYEVAKKIINTIKDTFLKYSKEIFAKLISLVYKIYTSIKRRDISGFEIENYFIVCPEYLNKGSIIETWKAVVEELEEQI